MSRSTLLLGTCALLVTGCLGQTVDDVADFQDLARSPDLAAPVYDLAMAPASDLSVDTDAALSVDLGVDLGTRGDMVRAADLATGPASCLPSGGCGAGPPCGNGCCGAGEECDPNTNTCRCGAGPACAAQMTCASGVFRMDRCGSICCGGGGVPCPP